MTTIARGASHSRDAEEILREVRTLADAGCREVVLTGVHAGAYLDGRDTDLGGLIDRILAGTEIPRLRLSSLEPWNFKPHWVALWSRYEGRLCAHLHMSVQSGSASVLRRMARPYDPATYANKLAALRDAIPDLGVTTDIIVGFPGETDEEHAESLAFVDAMAYSGAHIFTYSSRPGTEAAQMPGHIPPAVKETRYREMKRAASRSAKAFEAAMLGKDVRVLWESRDNEGRAWGWTENYLRVYAPPGSAEPNTITTVTLAADQQGKLHARAPDACPAGISG
jgi:threonylcarbamoyladenosine tRNA methylthiotransferase MtaB